MWLPTERHIPPGTDGRSLGAPGTNQNHTGTSGIDGNGTAVDEALLRVPCGIPSMSKTMRAHHVGITVSDLDRCLPFYRDVLGLDVIDRFSVSGEAFSTGVGLEDATGNFVHLDAEGARVELVSYEPPGEERARDRVDQPGASHLGLAVEDMAVFYEGLPDDVETVSEPQTTESGSTILFVRDPEGNLVELIET